MKTKEELAALKQEYEALTGKLKTLTPEEILQVTGGLDDLDKRELPASDNSIYGGIINNM